MREYSDKEYGEILLALSRSESSLVFETKFNMSRRDIESFKNKHGILSHDDAKRLLRGIKPSETKLTKKSLPIAVSDTQEKVTKKKRVVSKSTIDKKRKAAENRLEKSKNVPVSEWRLKNESEDSIRMFRDDIVGRGLSFCKSKYGVSGEDIMAEANRLKVKVNWDLVRR